MRMGQPSGYYTVQEYRDEALTDPAMHLHVIPRQSIHLIERGKCWCYPRILNAEQVKVDPDVPTVWLHKLFTPKGENGPWPLMKCGSPR